MGSTTVDLRLAVYRSILETGRVPTVSDLVSQCGKARDEVVAELRRLQDFHALALAPASDEILMAHPFSAVPTPYAVRTPERTYWANCAWDAVSIPAMLAADAVVDARCADCAAPLALTFRGGRLREVDAVIHFAVPPREFWRNVVYT